MSAGFNSRRCAPYSLVTLMEILQASAESFWRLSSLIGQLLVRLEQPTITEQAMTVAVATLGELAREADRMELGLASRQIDRIKEHLFEKRGTLADLRLLIVDLHLRMCDEVEDRYFLSIPPEMIYLYRQSDPPFGKDVEIKALDHNLDETKALAQAAAHLYNVKVAWRNEVMHPKQTYTPAEALIIFSSASIFIRDLSAMF